MANKDEQMNFVDAIFAYEATEEIKPRDSYVRAPFAWPGCKFNSLDFIIPKLPLGKTFVDGCGGSGVVTLNLPHNYPLKVFNDRHAGITAFYRCMRDNAKSQAVKKWLEMSLHSREDFIWCRDSWTNCQDDVERAARWYYMVRTSFSHLGRNWARATGGRAQIGAALHNGLDLFSLINWRFREVQVENQDVEQCIRDYDSDGTVFYIDPDYIGTDPGIYEHKVRHRNMLDLVFSSKGWFAVSHYKNDLYESYNWSERYEWEVTSTMRSAAFDEGNNLAGKQNVMGRGDTAIEVLYIKDFQ